MFCNIKIAILTFSLDALAAFKEKIGHSSLINVQETSQVAARREHRATCIDDSICTTGQLVTPVKSIERSARD